MHWIKVLDDQYGPLLTEAAQRELGRGCRSELDFNNEAVRIVVLHTPAAEAVRGAKAAVRDQARALCPPLAICEIYAKKPQTTTYTPHLLSLPQDVRPFDAPSIFTTFDLPLEDVIDLRNIEGQLAARADAAVRVIGFALGGISTLSRLSMGQWDSLAIRPVADGVAAADLTRERIHLFPGLNWRAPGMKDRFIRWVEELNVSGKMLIFDTGTEGHGLRQIFRLLRERLRHSETKRDLEFEIVGIVDGDNLDSTKDAFSGCTKNGRRFSLTLEYLRVNRVLSEDFQRLIGYRAFRALGYLHPLRDSGLVRLVDKGKLVQITATDNLADVFRGYMTNAVGGPERLARKGQEVLTDDIERGIAAQVLDYTKNGELILLHQARAMGLLTESDCHRLLADIDARYAAEIARYPLHVWSFENKKVREKSDAGEEIWSDG